MPSSGILSVTTPGTVDGWAEILEKHGTMTFAEVLQPAIEYAEHGFPVSEIIAEQWKRNGSLMQQKKEASEQYLINGKAPREGEFFKIPQLANTLMKIAKDGKDAFYQGEIAREIADYVAEHDGLLNYEDLATHRSTWVELISTNYKGYDVFHLKPIGKYGVYLKMVNIVVYYL